MATGNFIAYLRVSTAKQGQSGLGLEAQQRAVEGFLNGGSWTLVETFVEVESGKNNERPKLAEAIEACHIYGATLVIAKLDRLSRNAHFLLGLQEAGVKFVCCDMPQANTLTIGIMALVAQQEREAISERTRAALQSAKVRGVKLGGDRGNFGEVSVAGRAEGRKSQTQAANERAKRLATTLKRLQAQGMSMNAMAAELNGRGVATARGGLWTPTAVKRVLGRLEGF